MEARLARVPRRGSGSTGDGGRAGSAATARSHLALPRPAPEPSGFPPEREDSPVLPTPLAPTTAILTSRRPAALRQKSAAAALPGAGYSAMVHMF